MYFVRLATVQNRLFRGSVGVNIKPLIFIIFTGNDFSFAKKTNCGLGKLPTLPGSPLQLHDGFPIADLDQVETMILEQDQK